MIIKTGKKKCAKKANERERKIPNKAINSDIAFGSSIKMCQACNQALQLEFQTSVSSPHFLGEKVG